MSDEALKPGSNAGGANASDHESKEALSSRQELLDTDLEGVAGGWPAGSKGDRNRNYG